MERKETGALNEFFDAIKFCLESKKGRYSLQTYLDIVGEYADRQILASEENGLTYMGGDCRVKMNNSAKVIVFNVKLFFKDRTGESIEKGAERELPLNKFVSETVKQIGNEELIFNISRPEGK